MMHFFLLTFFILFHRIAITESLLSRNTILNILYIARIKILTSFITERLYNLGSVLLGIFGA